MSVNWTKFSQSELVSIAFCNSSSFINGAVTTLIIALVTGIAIAAFGVVIFDFWIAIDNSPPNLSEFSKTAASSGKSTLWTKNFSNTHWLALLLDIWANLISLFVISTPSISSPWAVDFPNLDLKKPSNLLLKPPLPNAEIFGVLIPLPKEGFFNLIFFNLSKKLEGVLLSEASLSSTEVETVCVEAGSGAFSVKEVISVGLGVSIVVGVACSVVTGGCSSVVTDVSAVSLEICCSLSLFLWISSNHFSNIGIASSRLGVPEEEIFCFPSI